ncbi:MAG: putative xanthine dehydrogenase FAD-binding subunit [Ilumatobacteraceae bacterium]|nr:putative xanthine dehydrogenase FAD-binding subunit [Ilumatobacteraceae bacterium]
MSVEVLSTLHEALQQLAARPDALILGGGTDLMVELNSGHRRADAVVCVNRVRELRSWLHDPQAGTVHLGAAVTYAELMTEPLASLLPALAQAARTVGSPQIRHAATIGGNVATSSPAGDGLPVLAALDAVVHVASAAGSRDVAFGQFATGPKRNVLQPGELITGITVPVLDGHQGYSKVGVRNAMVIATASACLAVDVPSRSIRLALGSVGPVIIRATDAERLGENGVQWEQRAVDEDTVAAFAASARDAARPIDDHRSTAAYRSRAIEVLAGRLLLRAYPGAAS